MSHLSGARGGGQPTLLGQNLSSECPVARFLAPEGLIDELLEIEG